LGAPGLKGPAYVLICLLFAGCDEDPPDPPDAPPAGVEQITGSERIGWEQRAATAGELAAIRYNIYVDNAPGAEVQDVQCGDTPAAGGFPCSGRLPQMGPGQHTLALTSFVDGASGRLESARSGTLTVRVGQSSQPFVPPAGTSFTTSDGVHLRALAVATGFADPVDLAVAPDGQIFVAERAGSIRVVRDGSLLALPAITLDDVDARADRGLLALAIDPEYERNGHLFAAYTTASDLRLVRLRHAGGTLGDPITLLDAIDAPLPSPAVALRIGPDSKLYLALDDGGDAGASADAASYSGKVLRLNRDGTTPLDQAGATPVFASGLSAPRGLGWGAQDARLLWVVESDPPGTGRLLAVVSATAPRQGVPAMNYTLPERTGPAGLALYRGDLIPSFAGDLLIPVADRGAILRLRVDPADPAKIAASERLMDGTLEPISAIAVSPRGEIYFCAADTLYLLAPSPATPAPR
jgi:glucose/arabinose dehydrogenase